MANITDGFKDIFLAGVGVMALGGEKAKEVVDSLIEKGELTVEQGKEINQELTHKATQTATAARDELLKKHIESLSEEERNQLLATVTKFVADAKESEVVVEVEEVPENDEESEADAEEKAE